MKPAPAELTFDFELLQRSGESHARRSRRALWWLLGFLTLLVASMVTLVLYLQTFEAEEDQRRRIADTEWLEQSVRFHFRRLEDDLTAMARGASESRPGQRDDSDLKSGLLWAEPGVVLAHGWLPAGASDPLPGTLGRLTQDAAANAGNQAALNVMQDVTRHLRRSTYAGPMRTGDGRSSDVIWLAVPVFDRGAYAGSYLAALSLNAAVQALTPAWFRQSHALQLSDSQSGASDASAAAAAFPAQLDLPGTDLTVQVTPLREQPATVPRMFFAAAMLFLLGMLASLVALRRDFGKRQRVEAQLQAQVALRQAMENSVTTGLRAWDLQGRILYVNQAFCRMVGFDRDELIGRSAPLPYWPDGQADELALIHRRVTTRGTEQAGVEVQFRHRDGRLIDVLVHEAPLNGGDGRQLGWMSSVLDISERKRAERVAARQQERLEASGRLVAVGEAASTLAHELNQPLGALSSFANGLLNRLRGGRITLDEVVPVVERMDRLSEKAGRIIHRVNAFARRREMTRQRLDLVPFLRGVLKQRPQPVSFSAPATPVRVDADALLLEHAVHNIVANAQHWAARGTGPARVRLTLSTRDGQAAIDVGDSGPGVSDEEKEQIFSAFFSASEDGMGMGLAICRSVIEAHHGRIDVGKDPQLGGALFTLWLPLAAETPAAEGAGKTVQDETPHTGEPDARIPEAADEPHDPHR
ncbi:MAG: PAS domain S-box protein [Burkholderiaceae bacterium]|nr:PAS domain S-box protein [Burkholderiaceae bacterium]